jgi:hypothetical protein
MQGVQLFILKTINKGQAPSSHPTLQNKTTK